MATKMDTEDKAVKKILDAQPKVRILIQSERPLWEGSINGLTLLIKTNEYVDVPQDVATLIEQNATVLRESEKAIKKFLEKLAK